MATRLLPGSCTQNSASSISWCISWSRMKSRGASGAVLYGDIIAISHRTLTDHNESPPPPATTRQRRLRFTYLKLDRSESATAVHRAAGILPAFGRSRISAASVTAFMRPSSGPVDHFNMIYCRCRSDYRYESNSKQQIAANEPLDRKPASSIHNDRYNTASKLLQYW